MSHDESKGHQEVHYVFKYSGYKIGKLIENESKIKRGWQPNFVWIFFFFFESVLIIIILKVKHLTIFLKNYFSDSSG